MNMNQIIEFKNFYEGVKDKKLPLKVAYKLNKLILKVEEEIKFYQDTFSKIVDEYAEKDENGNYVFIDGNAAIKIIPGKEEECDKKIKELNELPLNIEGIEFNLDELDCLDMTIAEMNCLMPFIKN